MATVTTGMATVTFMATVTTYMATVTNNNVYEEVELGGFWIPTPFADHS